MDKSIILQKPPQQAAQLVLIFHGVGASAADMAPIGSYIARALPHAMVVSTDAAHPSDFGRGRQWFSVQEITEANRIERVANAMPTFIDCIRHWQNQAGVSAQQTLLLGFSQGAIMLLEATQLDETLATKIIAIAGRFAELPRKKPRTNQIYLLHGDQDNVINVNYSKQAFEYIQQFSVPCQLDVFPQLGHGIDQRVLEKIAEYLRAD